MSDTIQTLESFYQAYRRGTLHLTKPQHKIFKAILRGREERVLRNKTELSEALYLTIVCADEDIKVELEWWKARKVDPLEKSLKTPPQIDSQGGKSHKKISTPRLKT